MFNIQSTINPHFRSSSFKLCNTVDSNAVYNVYTGAGIFRVGAGKVLELGFCDGVAGDKEEMVLEEGDGDWEGTGWD